MPHTQPVYGASTILEMYRLSFSEDVGVVSQLLCFGALKELQSLHLLAKIKRGFTCPSSGPSSSLVLSLVLLFPWDRTGMPVLQTEVVLAMARILVSSFSC